MTYIEGNDEEESVCQNGPDEDIAKNSGHQAVRVRHHDGAVPVNGHKRPCQRACSNRNVNEARDGVVAEIQRAEVEEVENQYDLGDVEVRVHKEHYECKVKQVVEDEVAADTSSCGNDVGTAGEERCDVSKLEDEENNPGFQLSESLSEN